MEQRDMEAETFSRMTTSRSFSSPTGSPRKLTDHVRMPSDESSEVQSGPEVSLMGFPTQPELSSGRFSVSTGPGPSTISTPDEEDAEGSPCGHPFSVFILVIIHLSLLVPLLWVASRLKEPKITVHSIAFEDFYIQAGIDDSAEPTMMATLNSTVNLTYHGPSFGVRVTSTSLDLTYLGLRLASGKVDDFYQSKESQRDIDVVVMGIEVALYAAGSSLSELVPLTLGFSLRSSVHLVGVLVKSNFHTTIQCSFEMHRTKLNIPISLMRSCRYS